MNKAFNNLNTFLFKEVSIAPLVIFRLVFGSLLLYSTYRTYEKGWIEEMYIDPYYHFSFVEWIRPMDGNGMYWIYALLALASIGIILGLFYRLSIISFFLLFTYCELIDKTYYLNHYYLVTILTFWMIWAPAHRWFSLDAKIFPKIQSSTCALWHILILKIQLSIVYFFAGLAKVNSDWLFEAQPMATWLPGLYEIPIIGKLVHHKELAFLFSWTGCIYDLTIWIFLWMKRTRALAYLAVIVFHVLTAVLFPRIGMFPYIMVTSTLIFFSAAWYERILLFFGQGIKEVTTSMHRQLHASNKSFISCVLIGYLILQLYLPLRYLQYPGNLFWHEQGYRFSWRVMLMEKNGLTNIILKDPVRDIRKEVDQNLYLTPFQKQQMRAQPDMLIQFAQFIGHQFQQENGYLPEVYVKSLISLNGRRSQVFTNESLNLIGLDDPMKNGWIVPFKENRK
jgi:hypothetical protein